jgi:hypothetical protein
MFLCLALLCLIGPRIFLDMEFFWSKPLQLVTRLQCCVGEGEFLLQMVDVNVAVECLCFQI